MCLEEDKARWAKIVVGSPKGLIRDTFMKIFGDKFRQLKGEGSRKKTVKTLFKGTESGARKNFQDGHGDS